MTEALRQSPLAPAHERLGARVTEFAGWEMPLQFEGVVAEHQAVREKVGVFDVSHLGKLRVRGDGRALQHALTADCLGLDVGRATYSLVLTDAGGCIDDVFVYRIDEDEWLVVPNAANVAAVARAIEESGGSPADEWERWAILAIQGPGSFDLFGRAFPNAHADELALHGWKPVDVLGQEGLVARTGYTGERGFELYAPADVALGAFERLLELGGRPVGLGARDTLRLEMGYALYGHELTLEINPLEAGLGWVISWDKDFRGKPELERIKAAGPARKLVGIRCTDRGVPRQGYPVYRGDDVIGELTSGNFSPTLGTGIGLALVDALRLPLAGESVEIEARGRRIAGDIVKPPFVKR
ncbi:MAG TPA: glycine cleavage system aminomethyltransferase GcvT [Actinomycetota bacterium]|nr:glycine cleavage system aminomethyltransferase GcvT [Actinomycetota bacterium]